MSQRLDLGIDILYYGNDARISQSFISLNFLALPVHGQYDSERWL